jgi:hypothetical protein
MLVGMMELVVTTKLQQVTRNERKENVFMSFEKCSICGIM